MLSSNDLSKFLALCTCLLFPLSALAQDLPAEPVSLDEASSVEGQEPNSLDELPSAKQPNSDAEEATSKIPQETESTVVAGPLQEQRQQLLEQIKAAEANGIGIKNYMMAFTYIEGMA